MIKQMIKEVTCGVCGIVLMRIAFGVLENQVMWVDPDFMWIKYLVEFSVYCVLVLTSIFLFKKA